MILMLLNILSIEEPEEYRWQQNRMKNFNV